MKRIHLIITLLSVLAILPLATFAQNATPTPKITANDDSDGDGIKNSDDLCPFNKGTIANRGCPGKDDGSVSEPTSTPFQNSNLKESDKQALADCQYVYQNARCEKFVGMSKDKIISIFGTSDSYGDYYRLGIHFWYFDDNRLGKITFYGNYGKHSPYFGKPAQNLEWKASIEETIKQLGEPVNRSNVGGYIDLDYGIYRFTFQNNQLLSVGIIDIEGNEIGRSSKPNSSEYFVAATAKTETPSQSPMPTPKTVVANLPVRSGSLADCKQILSDACRNFLLNSNIADVAPALGLIKQSAEKYSKSGLTVYVEPTSGGIISVRIFKDSGWQPSNNLKFGDKLSNVKEKYPNGEYASGRYNYDEALVYTNYRLEFDKGKLWVVELKRDRTDLEQTAKRTRDAEIRRQEAETEANKTPEQRAKEILAIYQSFHDRIEAKVKRHNDLAEELKDPVVNAFPSMFYARKNEMSKIRIEIPKMIDDFLTKYAGQLSQAMINHLNEDLEKLRSSKGH